MRDLLPEKVEGHDIAVMVSTPDLQALWSPADLKVRRVGFGSWVLVEILGAVEYILMWFCTSRIGAAFAAWCRFHSLTCSS
ncbi:MAG: hypothetical protein E6H66_08980 [Betaproteobacteria bacterium]|nr:MAG: hypothetical protein E6H66_08980 [Betaproteobacteria bacterium]